MKKVYRLQNLHCANCANKMQAKISALPNVKQAQISFMTQRLTIEAEESEQDNILEQARKIVSSIEKNCTIL